MLVVDSDCGCVFLVAVVGCGCVLWLLLWLGCGGGVVGTACAVFACADIL